MKDYDHTIGVIVLAGIACIASVVFAAGIPLLLEAEKVKLSDWLGFAGNILGGGVALVAATIAWKAVRQQTDAQREQMTLGAVLHQKTDVDREIIVVTACETILRKLQQILMDSDTAAEYQLQLIGLGFSCDWDQLVRKIAADANCDIANQNVMTVSQPIFTVMVVLDGMYSTEANHFAFAIRAKCFETFNEAAKELCVRRSQLREQQQMLNGFIHRITSELSGR